MNYKRNTFYDNKKLLRLWEKSQQGDKESFSELARLLYRVLANFATKFTKDKEFIKDVIQDLYLQLWEDRNEINITYVKIYFITALRNTILKKFRGSEFKIDKIDIDDEFDLSDNSNIEFDLINNEIFLEAAQKIKNAISNLPQRQQQALFLKFYKGLDNEKIAVIMNVNKQSIANLIYKAIVELRSEFLSKSVVFLVLLYVDNIF